MAETKYQVILFVNGNHSVSVTSDDPAALTEGLVWAKKTYQTLASRAARKSREQGEEEEIPVCEVHDVPMVRQEGKYGPFWSCHQRNEDGSFCSYRPADR